METKFANQINYREKKKEYPRYKLQRVEPESGYSVFTLPAGGGTLTQFRLPANSVYNLSRSFLCFTATPEASGNFNHLYADFFPFISRLQVKTDSGNMLIDLKDVARHTKMTWKAGIKLSDYLSYERWDDGAGIAINYLQKSDAITGTYARITPYVGPAPAAVRNFVIGPTYTISGGNATATPVVRIRFQLGMLLHTLFELDKDLPFHEVLEINITWNRTSNILYTGDDAVDPQDNRVMYNGSIDITNLCILLAQEQNKNIKDYLISQSKTERGVRTLLDYTHQRITPLFGQNQSPIYRINKSHGQRLKRIYSSLFDSTPLNAVVNTNYGAAGAATRKVLNFHTSLDNERLQDYNLNCLEHDDYVFLQNIIKGSVYQSSQMYDTSWVWIDDWTVIKNVEDEDASDDNIKEGISLETEKLYQFQAETRNDAFTHLASIVGQKELILNKDGVNLQ